MFQQKNPANDELIVNINGHLLPRDQAGVSPFDSSVQNGDAVWEGLRLYEGRIFRLEAHLVRLQKSAAMLAYRGVPSNETLVEELRRTLHANRMSHNVHIRLTVSRGLKYTSGLDPRINQEGCSFFLLAEHKPPVFDNACGIRLIIAQQRRPFASVLDQRIHSCNQLTSILAKLEATAAGVDDAVLLDPEGMLAETSSTHLFVVSDGRVMTSTTRACPEGITRQVVLDICRELGVPHEARNVSVAEMADADEMFVTGTMGEITPVAALGRREFGPIPGPLTTVIANRFRELTASPAEGYQIV